MSGTEKQQAPEQPEDMSGEEYQKTLKKFEKVYRMLDADDGTAQVAFSQARQMLPKLGLTFGKILDMLDNPSGGNEEELLQIIEEYKAANDQLKEAEGIIVSENERLNFLLRNFRDVDSQSIGFDTKEFKAALTDTVDKTEQLAKGLSGLMLPSGDDLEALYKMRVAEALMAQQQKHPAHKKSWVQRVLIWGLRQTGRDISSGNEDVEKMQSLVVAQDKIIKDQAHLLQDVESVRQKNSDIQQKIDLILGSSAPEQAYHEALNHLKDLQLLVGDGEDIKSLQEKNLLLESTIDTLKEEKQEIQDLANMQLSVLHNELDKERDRSSRIFNAAARKRGHDSGKSHNATSFTPPVTAAPDPDLIVDAANYKAMERRLEIQDKEINTLHGDLAKHDVKTIFSAEEAAIVDKLERYEPMLQQAADKLQNAADVLKAPPKRNFLQRILAIGWKNKEKSKIEKATNEIKKVADTVDQASHLVQKIEHSFNDQAGKCEAEIHEKIVHYSDTALVNLKDSYNEYEDKFRETLLDIRGEHEVYLGELQAQIDEKSKDLAKFAKLEEEFLEKTASFPPKAPTLTKKMKDEQLQVASEFFLRAVYNKDYDAIEFFLKKGADINAYPHAKNKDIFGDAKGNKKNMNALHYAANEKDVNLVAFLIGNGANVFCKNDDGMNVFDILDTKNASSGKVQEIKKMIFSVLPNMQQPINKSKNIEAEQIAIMSAELLSAVKECSIGRVSVALHKGANVNIVDAEGMTPLMHAVISSSNSAVLNSLLVHNANVFVKDNNDKNVFDHIAESKHLSSADRYNMASCLFAHFPNAAVQDRPIVYAPANKQEAQDILDMLFVSAFINHNKEGMEKALSKGADINQQESESGHTFLMKAVLHENPALFAFLIEKGADPYLKDNEDHSVFDFVQKQWRNENAKAAITDLMLDIHPGIQKAKAVKKKKDNNALNM